MSSSDSDSSSEAGAVSRQPLKGHSKSYNICSVAYAPDGSWFASCSEDETIRMWDSKTGHQIGKALEGNTDTVFSLAISPEGTRLVSGDDDDTVTVWDVTTHDIVLGPLEGHSARVWAVRYSPLGDLIASGSRDHTVRLWNAESGECVGTLKHPHIVTGLSFAPSGKHVATTCSDGLVRIWDLKEMKPALEPLAGHIGSVWSVIYSEDGEMLASGGRDCTIRIWNAHTGTLVLGPLKGHTLPVRGICFSPDGQKLVSASDDRSVRAWDLSTGRYFWGPIYSKVCLWSVSMSPDGLRVVLGGSKGKLFVRDALSGELILPKGDDYKPKRGELLTTVYGVRALAWYPDGKRFATAGDDLLVKTWNITSPEHGFELQDPFVNHLDTITSIAISCDGSTLVSAATTVCVWKTDSGELAMPPIERHTETVTAVLLTPDNNLLITASRDRTVCFWNVHNGRFLRAIEHEKPVIALSLSPDGLTLASGSNGGAIRFWHVDSGSESSLASHVQIPDEANILSLSFHPDGSRILAASSDNAARIWCFPSGEEVLAVNHDRRVNCVQYSSDGLVFLTACDDNHVRICDAESGEVLRSLKHDRDIRAASFSPDGTRIASATQSGCIRIWETESGKLLLGKSMDNSDEESAKDQGKSTRREAGAHESVESFKLPATTQRRRPRRDHDHDARQSNVVRDSSRPGKTEPLAQRHTRGTRGMKSLFKRITSRNSSTNEGNKRSLSLRRMVSVPVARAKERLAGVVDPEGDEADTESNDEENDDENANQPPAPDQPTHRGDTSSTEDVSTCLCIPSKRK